MRIRWRRYWGRCCGVEGLGAAGVAGCGKVFYKSIKIVDYLFGDWCIAYYLYPIKSAIIADLISLMPWLAA